MKMIEGREIEDAKRLIEHWKQLEKNRRQNICFYYKIIKYLSKEGYSKDEILEIMLEFVKDADLIQDFQKAYEKILLERDN